MHKNMGDHRAELPSVMFWNCLENAGQGASPRGGHNPIVFVCADFCVGSPSRRSGSPSAWLALGLAFFRPQHGSGGWTLVPRFDFGLWWADLPRHLIWLIPFLLLSASLPALRAIMWGFTAPAPPPSYGVRYHAIAIGALVHNTMPARLGLLVTAIFAGRRVRRPVVEMLASLLVAKLLEMAALVRGHRGRAAADGHRRRGRRVGRRPGLRAHGAGRIRGGGAAGAAAGGAGDRRRPGWRRGCAGGARRHAWPASWRR